MLSDSWMAFVNWLANDKKSSFFATKSVSHLILHKEKEFNEVLFLSFEQTQEKEIAKLLGIDYWTTIVVYKDNEEKSRSIGETNKAKIYSQIKQL